MSKLKRILRNTGIVLVTLLFLFACYMYMFFDYIFLSPVIYELTSPDGKKSAYVISAGALQGHSSSLLVSPTKDPDDAVWLGVVGSDRLRLESLEWSKDSSFVAVSCYRRYFTPHPEFSKVDFLYTCAYDFKLSKYFTDKPFVGGFLGASITNWLPRDAKIREILARRGSLPPLFSNELKSEMRFLSWFEWMSWRKHLQPSIWQEALWETILRELMKKIGIKYKGRKRTISLTSEDKKVEISAKLKKHITSIAFGSSQFYIFADEFLKAFLEDKYITGISAEGLLSSAVYNGESSIRGDVTQEPTVNKGNEFDNLSELSGAILKSAAINKVLSAAISKQINDKSSSYNINHDRQKPEYTFRFSYTDIISFAADGETSDLFLTFRNAAIYGEFSVTIQNKTGKVLAASFEGFLSDYYDWEHSREQILAGEAAKFQANYKDNFSGADFNVFVRIKGDIALP